MLEMSALRCEGCSAIAAESDDQQFILPGDLVTGQARLNRPNYRWTEGSLPRNVRNLSEGIDAQLTIQTIDKVQHGDGLCYRPCVLLLPASFLLMRSQREWGGILMPWFLGRQDALQEADWQTLRTFGMTHAFVVSGLHLSLVALWIHLISGITRLVTLSMYSRFDYSRRLGFAAPATFTLSSRANRCPLSEHF